MLGTVSIKLKNITVSGYFPSPLTIEETLITGGTGVLTIAFFPPPPVPPTPQPDPTPEPVSSGVVFRGLRYTLQVNEGTRVYPLRHGQIVTVAASDEDKKVVPLATRLVTVDTGTPALFVGPTGWL